ncbi:hypothetical protein GQ457_16G013000 [Hibiscus cannabinus]
MGLAVWLFGIAVMRVVSRSWFKVNGCCTSAYLRGAQSLQVIPPPRDHVRWEAPPSGWYKLNSDGAVKGALGLASSGGVVRSEHGVLTIGYMKGIGVCSGRVLEYILGFTFGLIDGCPKIDD